MKTNGVGWILGLVLTVLTPMAMFAGGWGVGGGQKPDKDGYRLEGPFTQ